MTEKRVYFQSLNGLRFFAATAVIFHHVEQYKFWAGLPNIWGNTVIDALGHKAVSLFFVLSGFLITYLLLVEKQKTGTIQIKNFYLRRILRIWPLYFLIVTICLFILPYVFDLSTLHIDRTKNFALTAVLLFLVLPNVVRLINRQLVGGNQLWSIGVEEQFYIIWPIAVRVFIKRLPQFLISFILIKLIITIGLQIAVGNSHSLLLSKIYQFWVLLKIEQMTIGALGAWVLFHKKEDILSIIYSKPVWIVTILAALALMVVHYNHWSINYIEAFIFLSLIMNLSTNKDFPITLEYSWLGSLGNMAYGIYMYHTICITICLFTLRALSLDKINFTLFNIALYTFSILLTIGIAYLSYNFFEKPFLNLKEKFMLVKSGKKD
jgi:peptidoglycan/LPS O-acetylase OafA/YrhL